MLLLCSFMTFCKTHRSESGSGTPVTVSVCPGLKDMFWTTTPWKRERCCYSKNTRSLKSTWAAGASAWLIIKRAERDLFSALSWLYKPTELNYRTSVCICFHSRVIHEAGTAPAWAWLVQSDSMIMFLQRILKLQLEWWRIRNKRAGTSDFPFRRTCAEPRVRVYTAHVAPDVFWKVLQRG